MPVERAGVILVPCESAGWSGEPAADLACRVWHGREVAGRCPRRAGGGGLASRYGCSVSVVGLANARDGFVYSANGLDLGSARAAASSGRQITEQRGARVWPSA